MAILSGIPGLIIFLAGVRLKSWGILTLRQQGVAEAEKVILPLDEFPIQIVEVDKNLAYEAAKLKGEVRIAYADCLAAALSMRLNAFLVTGDPDFKKLQRRVSIRWINLHKPSN
jgi:uncharacterized protein